MTQEISKRGIGNGHFLGMANYKFISKLLVMNVTHKFSLPTECTYFIDEWFSHLDAILHLIKINLKRSS